MLKQIVALGLCLAVSSYIAPQPARAGDNDGSCGGNLIDYTPFNVGGQKIGQLQFYYNASNGVNCAIMLHGGPTWGSSRVTGVGIYVSDRQGNLQSQLAYQSGTYNYQAGPIRANGRNTCTVAGGGISYQGSHHTLFTGPHCA